MSIYHQWFLNNGMFLVTTIFELLPCVAPGGTGQARVQSERLGGKKIQAAGAPARNTTATHVEKVTNKNMYYLTLMLEIYTTHKEIITLIDSDT